MQTFENQQQNEWQFRKIIIIDEKTRKQTTD